MLVLAGQHVGSGVGSAKLYPWKVGGGQPGREGGREKSGNHLTG